MRFGDWRRGIGPSRINKCQTLPEKVPADLKRGDIHRCFSRSLRRRVPQFYRQVDKVKCRIHDTLYILQTQKLRQTDVIRRGPHNSKDKC